MSNNNSYNKFKPDHLRLLLTQIDIFDKEVAEISLDLSMRQHEYTKINQAELSWAQLYEKPFNECLAIFFVLNGMSEDIKFAAESEDKLQALNEITEKIDPHLDSILNEINDMEGQKQFITFNASLSLLCINSIRSLMIYGQYINELIEISRESTDFKLADKALIQAIRIDPSAVGCPIALKRISRAVFFGDHKFLKKIQNAFTGKLGVRENKNYRKMRFILQVLHESGGIDLNDKDLKELFVKHLNLYSYTQSSSEKNLKELAYNFKKQKSTI